MLNTTVQIEDTQLSVKYSVTQWIHGLASIFELDRCTMEVEFKNETFKLLDMRAKTTRDGNFARKSRHISINENIQSYNNEY